MLAEAQTRFAPQPGIAKKAAAIRKAIAYLILAFVGSLIATAISKALFGASLLDLAQGGAAMGAVRAVLLLFALVVLPTTVMLTVCKEPLRFSGWAVAGASRLLGWGLATGLGLMATIAAAMWLLGAATFTLAVPTLSSAASGMLVSVLLWIVQAAGEEGLNRGYAFVQISRAISFWPTAVLSSAWFMAGHLGNHGETSIGLVSAGLFGLALSYSLLKTGSLWFALGFHAAWNFTQSFVFGFHNSGGETPVSYLTASVSGSPFLTGGATGPEASLLVLPALAILLAIIRWKITPIASPTYPVT